MKLKINRKGFTLVELLVTILIVGIVIGLTVFGIITLTKDSEGKVTIINKKNVEEAARIYSAEAGSDSWKTNDEFDAFCTTVGELMNKGFIDKKASFDNGLTRNNYVIVKRNKITLAIDSTGVIEDNTGDDKICTGQNIIEDEEHTKPSISEVNKYTDRIEIDFNNGSAKSGIKNYKCLYGNSSSNVNREGIIDGNKCILEGLKNNNVYYVLIYMNTNKGSSILASGDREYITKDFEDTTISQNGNKINIVYNDDTIYRKEGYHYFKSGISGTSSENVVSCDLNKNKFTCDGSTNVLEKDKWYKVNNKNITITYPEENNKFNIDTKICDDSNNCKDKNKEITINKYVVKFYRNGALSIDGSTSEYIEKYCITGGNSTCNIVAPSITRPVGYSVVGWNTSSGATSSEWNVGATKEINSNVNYYAISRINKVYIKYNVNGGYIATSSNDSGTWTKNSSGTVLLNNSAFRASINYGANIGTNGLNNWNNSSALNINKKGYSAVSGSEWKCLSGNCIQNTYSHGPYSDTGYTASDFCDASNGDCTVELGVNWNINKVNIKYNVNGGSIATGSNSSGTWTKNSGGTVLLNGSVLTASLNYGGTLSSSGLANYNNSSYLNISKTGYSAVSGAEWKCLSGNCKRDTYNHATAYSASDFCDASSGDCTVELGVNWTPVTYTISYNLNGGTVSVANNTTYNIETNSFTLNNPTKEGYTFVGWTGSNGTTKQTSVTISKGSTGDKSYTANWKQNTTTVNANKFACENSRLAVYYVTVCTGNTCTYTKNNGLDSSFSFALEDTAPTWSINKTSYVDSLDNLSSSCSYSLRYVTASDAINCRSAASTDSSVVRTFNRCTSLNVYPTTIIYRNNYRWYYSKKYGCYLSGALLSSSKPSGCSSSTIKNYCVNIGSHTQCQCHGYNIGKSPSTILTSDSSLKNNSKCTQTMYYYMHGRNDNIPSDELVGCTISSSGYIATYQCTG